jgi:hypothetical protein
MSRASRRAAERSIGGGMMRHDAACRMHAASQRRGRGGSRRARHSYLVEDAAMPQCEVCGNDYERAFDVVMDGKRHTFDSFECAIHRLAPACAHCGCRVIGHGIERGDQIFCCASCARHEGALDANDHVAAARG